MTTVRILGSRAREQVPGTGITLLAPGFHGALTQLSAGSSPFVPHDLPFADAAAGAQILLAAQLTLSIETRPAEGVPGLRSRSAVATHPRIIVPRRQGVVYALLQTDETGASSFVSSVSQNEGEAIFPLTISALGATRRALRVLMWPARQAGPGASTIAADWERLRRPNQLAQCRADGSWGVPDRPALAAGAILLLLHDTFSTPQATFADWVGDNSFAPVFRAFGGRCLAFAHPTLTAGLDANLSWLLTQVAHLPGPFDIVAHGRGGLLARAIAADGRLPLRRVCQLGTPNNGTPLALEANLVRFLDGHVAMLARASPKVAQATLEGVLCMSRFVALASSEPLPGLAALAPDSTTLCALAASKPAAQQWFTVGAEFAAPGGHGDADERDEFSATPNDLVVPSEGCHEPGAEVAESLRLGGSDIHHHNYFSNQHVRDRLARWLH